MFQTGILLFAGLVFAVYGLCCLVNPSLPAGLAGFTMNTGDAVADVAATYGGLAIGAGVFLIIAALKAEHTRAGLVFLTWAGACLGLSRLVYIPIVAGDVSSFTYGAIVFEIGLAAMAWVAYKRLDDA